MIALSNEADRALPLETGGVLMGRWISLTEALIEEVIGPGHKAIHARTTFTPDYDFQEREIARVYAGSSGALTYLGDWHTHPKGVASLSRKDRTTLLRIAKSPDARATAPLMAIIAGGTPWKIGVWRGEVSRGVWSQRLDIVACDIRLD